MPVRVRARTLRETLKSDLLFQYREQIFGAIRRGLQLLMCQFGEPLALFFFVGCCLFCSRAFNGAAENSPVQSNVARKIRENPRHIG